MKKVLSILFAIFIGINVANANECTGNCYETCVKQGEQYYCPDGYIYYNTDPTNPVAIDCLLETEVKKCEAAYEKGSQLFNQCLLSVKYAEELSCPKKTDNETEKEEEKLPAQEESNTYKKIQCGDLTLPYFAAQITSTIINVLKIATPILIIIFGSVDLMKAVIAQKEDEIIKGRQTFIRRLIIGVCVFLVFVIVQLVINLVAQNNISWECVACFINGKC